MRGFDPTELPEADLDAVVAYLRAMALDQAQTQLFMRVPWVGMSDITTFQHLGIVQIAGPPHFHSILAHSLRLYAFYSEAVLSAPREPRYGRSRMAQRVGLEESCTIGPRHRRCLQYPSRKKSSRTL
jgi:hypothetical protein